MFPKFSIDCLECSRLLKSLLNLPVYTYSQCNGNNVTSDMEHSLWEKLHLEKSPRIQQSHFSTSFPHYVGVSAVEKRKN